MHELLLWSKYQMVCSVDFSSQLIYNHCNIFGSRLKSAWTPVRTLSETNPTFLGKNREVINTTASISEEMKHSLTSIERFSFECRKVIGFAITTLRDWLKRFAPPFHPIRSKTKTNRDALACIFPRFASATCNYFEFWLVHCIVCVLCDWLE